MEVNFINAVAPNAMLNNSVLPGDNIVQSILQESFKSSKHNTVHMFIK